MVVIVYAYTPGHPQPTTDALLSVDRPVLPSVDNINDAIQDR
jgi:hypothetical protein